MLSVQSITDANLRRAASHYWSVAKFVSTRLQERQRDNFDPVLKVVFGMGLGHDSAMNKDNPHGKASPIHSRFDLAGALILVVGLVIAAAIYATSADDGSAAVSQELMNTKRYEYQLERIGGKAAVFAVEFNQWFESLWHGKHLASTVAILSIVVALGCFFVAHVLSDDLPRDDKGDRLG
jgi:hypothetical protein